MNHAFGEYTLKHTILISSYLLWFKQGTLNVQPGSISLYKNQGLPEKPSLVAMVM